MRELINLLENVGLANRKPGEQFTNPSGQTLTFRSLNFYPDSGSYADIAQLAEEIDKIAAETGIGPGNILWSNTHKSNQLAFGLAHFTDDADEDFYIGRYFASISVHRASNNFPNNTIPGEYKLQNKVAKKESAGYKPSDILTQFESNTVESIIRQVEHKFGADSDEANAIRIFVDSDQHPIRIPKGNINADAFSNYFAELLQPMSLILGKHSTGNAHLAEDAFFGDQGFDTCVINFNSGSTSELYDSLLTNSQGKQIKISSKSKAGANASVVNLLNSARELNATEAGQKLFKDYKEEISILEIVSNSNYVDGPLTLAILFGIIDPTESNQVKALKNLSSTDDIIGANLLSKNLEKMYKSRSVKDESVVSPMYHLLAVVAHKVADYVNDHTNFGKAASAILNNGALIQVYTSISTSGNDIVIKPFNVVFPSEAVTGVVMSATKNYFSTGNKGKLSFKILKNGATEKDTEILDYATDTKPDFKERTPAPVIKAHSATQSPTTDTETLGRKRRSSF